MQPDKKALIVLTIFVIAGLSYFGFSRAIAQSENEQPWQPLSELINPEKLSAMVAENTSPSTDRRIIENSALGYQQGNLLLVDFNTPGMCGIGGCALAGYRSSTEERILAIYVQRIAPNEPIVEIVDQPGFELPCLLVPPDPNDENILAETDKDTLCYWNGTWSIQ